MNENKRTVTILIPCYNEEESLPMLFARLTTLSENAQLAPDDDDRIDYRFLFVDDGSKDSTRDEIREFASNRFDTGFIFLSRNFGKEHAMLTGIQLLALGVIGEYLGRTFIQTKNRPNYLIEEEQRPKER